MNKQVAEATQLTNVGARTYDPAIGKFVSVDPVIDTNLPQQNTGYAYSGNNPTTFMDPSGLKFAIDRANDSGGRKPVRFKPGSRLDEQFEKPWSFKKPSLHNSAARFSRFPGYPDSNSANFDVLGLLRSSNSHPISSGTPKLKGPAQQPLIEIIPDYPQPQVENGIGFEVCIVICYAQEWAQSGTSWSWTIGGKLEATISTGVSMQEPASLYIIGNCSATALLGATAEVGLGIAEDQSTFPGGVRLAGTSSGGIKYGVGGGCAVGIKGSY